MCSPANKKDNTSQTKFIPGMQCSWNGRFNIVKMSLLFKMIYGCDAISIKIPIALFAEIKKLILKFI